MNECSKVLIKYTKSYDRTLKKLKKYHHELAHLEKIISLIKNSNNVYELESNPLAKMYHLERLKYQFNQFHSFNLSKSGGTIRLIVRFIYERNEVELVFISFDHYKDFSEEKVMNYDE